MKKTRILLAALLLVACIGVFCPLHADETVTGKLTVDQNTTATALEIKGGASGTNLAVFRRDIGADAEVRIDAVGANPEIVFDDLVTTSSDGLWAVGLSAGDNSFRIVNNGSIYGATNQFFTIENGGNVGIGTITPPAKLSVAPGISANYSLASRTINQGVLVQPTSGRMGYAVVGTNSSLSDGSDNAAFGFYHPFNASDAQAGYKVFRITTGTESGVTNTAASAITDRFFVRKDGGAFFGGNVGIGTTNPTQKLSVNGTVRAKEVIVDTGWSDYVFDDDYRLAPLTEVEAHIRERRHLPGIPTAQEVSESGISLGDMQAKLLAKVEELTLHLIDQDKRILKLESENAALRGASKHTPIATDD